MSIVPSTCAVDIHHPGKTMVACSLCLIAASKRGIFLGRLFAQLQFHGCRFTTADLDDAVRLALKGLIQKSAA